MSEQGPDRPVLQPGQYNSQNALQDRQQQQSVLVVRHPLPQVVARYQQSVVLLQVQPQVLLSRVEVLRTAVELVPAQLAVLRPCHALVLYLDLDSQLQRKVALERN